MRIIVLTKSDKHRFDRNGEELPEGGFCVAGIDEETHEWVRLVGRRRHLKITYAELRYENGEDCEPLDLIEVNGRFIDEDFLRNAPEAEYDYIKNSYVYDEASQTWDMLHVQPENFLVDNRPFRLIDRYTITELLEILPLEERDYIFSNAERSLSAADAIANGHSLTIAKVDHLQLYPEKDDNDQYRAHYKANFRYNGHTYEGITVTDPDYAAELTEYDELFFGDTYMVISVGEAFRERHYKLIAKIFEVVYMIPNNRLSYFHAYRDCRYLQNYQDNVTKALIQEVESQGMTQCKECERRLFED